MLAANYPFLDVLWTMLIFFAWVIWFWLLITIFSDLFRRHDIGGIGIDLYPPFIDFSQPVPGVVEMFDSEGLRSRV